MISVLELRSVRGTGGGPEKTILCGAARHDRRRFRVTICYIRDVRDQVFGMDARARQLGVDYVEVSERHSFDRSIWPELRAIVRDRRIDLIHGHEYKTNLLAWLLGRQTGAIPLATAHGWTGDSPRERWVYYPADRQVLKRLPRVIAVSSDIRQRLIKAGASAARVPVLLNGIEPADFRRDPAIRERVRREMGFLVRDQVVGAVGRLEPQKRFDLLLDAFARLRRDWPHARLVLVGDGSLRDRLERQAARLGLGHACHFLGHRLDIAGLHNAFDLFVQSSDYEGTPNAVLEAMAMETPIVATDAGGTTELAADGDHARVVPSGDADVLRRAMQDALAEPQAARRRAAAARQRIERDLSFAERTRKLEDIYVDLMGECGRSGGRDDDADALGARSA
jgi:glycosyltransferase involved in cell wall biosynthesis